MASTTTTRTARDGASILTRRWEATDPIAAVLIVHGLGEHSGRYDHVGDKFVEDGLRVEAFDLRGHGATDGRRMYVESWDDFLDDVEWMLDDVRSDDLPTVLYGHSMGGLIALSYALSGRPAPDLLVLSAPAIEATVPAVKRVAARVLGRVAPKLSMPSDITGEMLSRDPAVGEAYFADPLVETKITAGLGWAMLDTMEQVRPLMSRLTIPTLVVHGGADTLVPARGSAALAEVPAVERVLYPTLRHELHNEPEQGEVVDAISSWVRSHAAGETGD